MKRYIVNYEIDHYEVHLRYANPKLDEDIYTFDTEENAINFISSYINTHPGWSYKLLKVEHAIVTVTEEVE